MNYCANIHHDSASVIDDMKGNQSWRIFRIISEITEGFDRLSGVCDGISILARPGLSRAILIRLSLWIFGIFLCAR